MEEKISMLPKGTIVYAIFDDGTEDGIELGKGCIERIDNKDLLCFEINVASVGKHKGHGTVVFDMLYEELEKERNDGMCAKWIDDDDLNDNLTALNLAIQKGIPEKEAALYYTFTGKMAQRKELKITEIKGGLHQDGKMYAYVERIIFSKE